MKVGSIHEKKEGERLIDFFIVKEKEANIAANGSEYLSVVLGNRNGQIRAKLWDVTEEQKELIQKRAIIKVDGFITIYRNQKHLTIQRVRLSNNEDQIGISDLLPEAKTPREELWQELRFFIDEIQSPVLNKVIKTLLSNKEIREKYTTIPATKEEHHPYYAGLLEHIVQLCHGAVQLLPLYKKLNKDIVLATCILHDIGKVKDLTDPIAPEHTISGELIGSVMLSVEMMNQAAYEAGISTENDEIMIVKHCIISHLSLEPVYSKGMKGKTMEAIFFQYLKELDSRINAIEQASEEGSEEWNYTPLFKRKILKT